MNKTLTLALILTLGACREPTENSGPAFALQEIRRYGWLEAPADAAGQAPQGLPIDAGVLGSPGGVVRGADSVTYVLDRQAKRIVGFGIDGAPKKVILGGSGDGPGEFRWPSHLAARRDQLTVLDSDLSRVSVFDVSGAFAGSFTLGRPSSRLAWMGDTAWVPSVGRPGVERPIAFAYSENGDSLAVAPFPSSEDQAFGEGLGVVASQDGSLIVNSARPGIWYEFRGNAWSTIGAPLFPDMEPPIVERTAERELTVTPAQASASGVALVGDSLVVQLYWEFTRPFSWENPPGRDEIRRHLGVFSRAGRALDDIVLSQPGLDFNHLEGDPASGHLFLFVSEPFPQVIEYALEVTPTLGR